MTSLTMDTAWNSLAFFKEGHFPEQELRYLLEHPGRVFSREQLLDAVWGHDIYALYVLAHFRWEELFPRVTALLKLPGEGLSNLLGRDRITGYGLPNIIASTFNGDFSLLTEAIENPGADDLVRACALRSITPLVLLEKLERETAIQYLMELAQTKLESQRFLWTALTGITMGLYLEELMPAMIDAFNKGIVGDYCTQEELINHFDAQEEEKEWRDEWMERDYHYIDAINDMKRWACFQPQVALKKRSDALTDALVAGMQSQQPTDSTHQQVPFVRGNKIGRNESCPCGSRKKYKKCCLLAHEGRETS